MCVTCIQALAAEKLIRNLSIKCLQDMGMKLSGPVGKNYKYLAGKLGFSTSDVGELESTDKINPGFALLQRWSQQNNTTVAVLMTYLRDMNRDDVLDVLNTELKGTYFHSVNKGWVYDINLFISFTFSNSVIKNDNLEISFMH